MSRKKDPLAHIKVGDEDPTPQNDWTPCCEAVEYIDGDVFWWSCTREPHPAHWQHIAGGLFVVGHTWKEK